MHHNHRLNKRHNLRNKLVHVWFFIPFSFSIYPWFANRQLDPLNIPVRRETTVRKAKAKGIDDLIGTTSENEEEPFADSDTDPVWTPQDDEYVSIFQQIR